MPRALKMSLSPTLSAHLLQQQLPAPSRWALNRWRLELDYASMIFCRRYLLSVDTDWFVHIRADASPQGGRDFLVCELDRCVIPQRDAQGLSDSQRITEVEISTRLLPLAIVGAKAASASHKALLLMKSLSLESQSLQETLRRTVTLLFDYGAESGIWKLSAAPFLDSAEKAHFHSPFAVVPAADPHGLQESELCRLFPRALPLADGDHALHHEHKKQMASLFKTICPSFVEHRWQYLFETLSWIAPRQQCLAYLKLEELSGGRDDGDGQDAALLSSNQLELLAGLCGDAVHNVAALKFWALTGLARLLADWGARFSWSLHSCPCHPRRLRRSELDKADKAAQSGKGKTVPCQMEGRMCVPLAAGLAEVAIHRLNAIGIPAHVQQALRQLEAADAGAARELMDGFKTAVSRISFRMKQAFGYWKELPWALLVIMRPWVEYFSSEEEALSCQK
ncbi:CELA2A, partial [Symbiodinium sp. CCMP2456]